MKLFRRAYFRFIFLVIVFSLEIGLTYFGFTWLGQKLVWVETILRILSVFILINLVNNSKQISQDMFWIVTIIISPIFGTALYVLIGANLFMSNTYKNIINETKLASSFYSQDPNTYDESLKDYPNYEGQIKYISKGSNFPIYKNTASTYYSLGEEGFPEIIKEIKKAKDFIFIEFFIIEEGIMWNGVLEILEEKIKEGVEVRVMYDDVGSIMTLDADYAKSLEQKGIKCQSFNRINPVLNVIINHRDHRKLLIIDGKVGFTGGFNFADEYINVKKRFGQWKDNVIMIKGEAVASMTLTFLTNWNSINKEDFNYNDFKSDHKEESDGYVIPYGDTPLDDELTGQYVYLNIINQAKKYLYITTPYLVINNEISNALILAAKRGVDVRIMTPGIPDKKLIYLITRSNYKVLLDGGVKIYEYNPGFLHSKIFIADDEIATVGTVNLDYRSLYLHFENGVILIGSKCIKDIKKDIINILSLCDEANEEKYKLGLIKRFLVSILKLFSPMM